jgi:hypothetical protein
MRYKNGQNHHWLTFYPLYPVRMNSLSFIHSGSSANVMVFLETGLEKDTGASESSSARRERGTCRWRRGADKVMMEVG